MSIATRLLETIIPRTIRPAATRLFLPASVQALAAISPSFIEGSFGSGRSLFTRPMVVNQGSLLREYEALARKSLPLTSPKFQVTDTDEKFKLSVDVPGVKASDINVSIENDTLSLSGERKEEKDNYSFASKFYQSFSLDPAVETDKFEAELKDGVLTVFAPKDPTKVEENIKKIPITELAGEETNETSDTKEAARFEKSKETSELAEAKENTLDEKIEPYAA